MVEGFVIFALFIWAVGGGDTSVLSPDTRAELSFFHQEQPRNCRPATLAELGARNERKHGKASNYSLKGFSVCERDIFAYSERDSFVSFVTGSTRTRAKDVSVKLIGLLDQTLAAEDFVWSMVIESDNEALGAYVRYVFESELYNTGRIQLSKLAPEAKANLESAGRAATPRLVVRIQRIDDIELALDTRAYMPAPGRGIKEWRL